MLRSLVGSEMCIRDSTNSSNKGKANNRDTIPAMLEIGESVITAKGTFANGNKDLFNWINTTGGSAIDYFKNDKNLLIDNKNYTNLVNQNNISDFEKMQNIEIEGVYTHFSTSDEGDKKYTYYQFDLFKEAIDLFKNSNIPIPYFHTANSGAILDLPETWLDIVRPGCLIYGLYPSVDVRRTIGLTPALSFKSRISFIKNVQTGSFIGYGKTCQVKRETRVATVPVGYADGYPRLLSNRGEVLIRGKMTRVLGRVCMDQLMADVTDIENATVGDEIVLWGIQGDKNIPVEDIARKVGTIVDEIVHLTDKARVAKMFIRDGKPWKIKNMLGEYACEG